MYFSHEAESSRTENPDDKTQKDLEDLKRELTPREKRKKERHEGWVTRKENRKKSLVEKINEREKEGRITKPLERRIGRIERQMWRYDENGNWLNRGERRDKLEATLNKPKNIPKAVDPWERDTSYDDYRFEPDQSETNSSNGHETYGSQEELTPHQENLRAIQKWLDDPYLGEIDYIAKLVLPNFKKEALSDEEGPEKVLQQIREKLDNNEIGPRLAGEIKIYLEGGTERRAEHIARLEAIHSKLDSLSTNQLRELAKIFDPTYPPEELKIDAFVMGVPTKDGTLIGVLPWLREDLKNIPGDFTFEQVDAAEKYLSSGKIESKKKLGHRTKVKKEVNQNEADKTSENITTSDLFEGIPMPSDDSEEKTTTTSDSGESERLYTTAEKDIIGDQSLPEYPEEESEDENTNGGV